MSFFDQRFRTSNDIRPYFYDKMEGSWMVDIDENFLQSQVSFYGLNQHVPHFSHASHAVRGKNYSVDDYDQDKIVKLIESCQLLYGLLHARYILTEEGIAAMKTLYSRHIFGKCPRLNCDNQPLLPIGTTTTPGIDTAKCYCPRCHDIYETGSKYDGAFFGTDFPVMFCKRIGIECNYIPFSLNSIDDGIQIELPPRLIRWGENTP